MTYKIEGRLNYLILDKVSKAEDQSSPIENPFEKETNWYKVLSSGPGIYSSTGNLITTDIFNEEIVYMANHGVKPFSLPDEDDLIYAASVLDAIAVVRDGKIVPYGNYVVIEPIEFTQKVGYSRTEIPEYWWGTIKRVGSGLKNEQNEFISLDLKEGDTVMFIPFRSIKLKYSHLGLEDVNEYFIDSSEIIGYVKKKC